MPFGHTFLTLQCHARRLCAVAAVSSALYGTADAQGQPPGPGQSSPRTPQGAPPPAGGSAAPQDWTWFGQLPEDTPPAVREPYDAALESFRDAIGQLRATHTSYHFAKDATGDDELLQQWTADLLACNTAASRWLDEMSRIYTTDPTKYLQLGQTLLAVVRSEAAEDRVGYLLTPAKTVLKHPPRPLDEKTLIDIGFVGYAHCDVELAREAWNKSKALAPLPPDIQSYYDALDELPAMWEREQRLRQQEASGNNPRVRMITNKGILTIELFEDVAPNHVASLVYLIEHGYYQPMRIFRAIPHQLVQTGCIKNDGTSNAGYRVAGEQVGESKRDIFRGSVFFALNFDPETATLDPDTASSQFIIAAASLPALNDEATVMGRVVENIEILGMFNKLDLAQKDEQPPYEADTMIRLEATQLRDHPYEPEPAEGTLPY